MIFDCYIKSLTSPGVLIVAIEHQLKCHIAMISPSSMSTSVNFRWVGLTCEALTQSFGMRTPDKVLDEKRSAALILTSEADITDQSEIDRFGRAGTQTKGDDCAEVEYCSVASLVFLSQLASTRLVMEDEQVGIDEVEVKTSVTARRSRFRCLAAFSSPCRHFKIAATVVTYSRVTLSMFLYPSATRHAMSLKETRPWLFLWSRFLALRLPEVA